VQDVFDFLTAWFQGCCTSLVANRRVAMVAPKRSWTSAPKSAEPDFDGTEMWRGRRCQLPVPHPELGVCAGFPKFVVALQIINW
jgi:hypothetical protein